MFGQKSTGSHNSFGSKLKSVGNIIKNSADIYEKINDVKNDLEKFRG